MRCRHKRNGASLPAAAVGCALELTSSGWSCALSVALSTVLRRGGLAWSATLGWTLTRRPARWRSGDRGRATADIAGGGDERTRAGGGGARIPGRLHLCLEEGTQSAWLYELLEPHVAEVVVAVPPKKQGRRRTTYGTPGRERRSSHGGDRDAGLQGTEAPGGACAMRCGRTGGDAGCGAGQESPEGGVSLARDRGGRERLRGAKRAASG